MTESLLTALILGIATLISSTFGFGSALFAMPLLTLLLGLKTAAALFGLVGPTIAAIILLRHWQQVDVASAGPLIVATWAGIPIGVWAIQYCPEQLIARLLAVGLIGFGLYRLGRWPLAKLDSPLWALPVGLIAGILGGAYNTNGPPVVLYGDMRRWSPSEFRSTLQGYFLPTGLGILLSHGLAGLWTQTVLALYGVSLPGILGAIAIGGWMNQRFSTERFQTLLSLLLIGLGVGVWGWG